MRKVKAVKWIRLNPELVNIQKLLPVVPFEYTEMSVPRFKAGTVVCVQVNQMFREGVGVSLVVKRQGSRKTVEFACERILPYNYLKGLLIPIEYNHDYRTYAAALAVHIANKTNVKFYSPSTGVFKFRMKFESFVTNAENPNESEVLKLLVITDGDAID